MTGRGYLTASTVFSVPFLTSWPTVLDAFSSALGHDFGCVAGLVGSFLRTLRGVLGCIFGRVAGLVRGLLGSLRRVLGRYLGGMAGCLCRLISRMARIFCGLFGIRRYILRQREWQYTQQGRSQYRFQNRLHMPSSTLLPEAACEYAASQQPTQEAEQEQEEEPA